MEKKRVILTEFDANKKRAIDKDKGTRQVGPQINDIVESQCLSTSSGRESGEPFERIGHIGEVSGALEEGFNLEDLFLNEPSHLFTVGSLN